MKIHLIIFVLTVITTASSYAQFCGDLDYTFGYNGIMYTDINNQTSVGHSMAIQSDGKIIVAGFSYNGSNYDFALVRYYANGNIDASFGTNGIVITDISGYDDYIYSLAIQDDERIIVAGYSSNGSNNDCSLARYNVDGDLDTTFNNTGIVITDQAYDDYAYSLVLDSDGKIVISGSSYDGSNTGILLIRYNPDGTLDSAFSSDGIVTTFIGNLFSIAQCVTIQQDGKLIITGICHIGVNPDIALIRYNTDGSLDTTFSDDGIVNTNVGPLSDEGFSVAIQLDGKIVVSGTTSDYTSTNSDFALVRYNTNGTIDSTFSFDGIVTNDISSHDMASQVLIQQDGKIVFAGRSFINSGYDIVLMRYNSDGSMDNSFSGGGIVIADFFGSHDEIFSTKLQTDGRILVAGYTFNNGYANFVVARYYCENVTVKGVECENAIGFYPNPSVDRINVFINNAIISPYTIAIYDINGNKLKEMLSAQTEIGVNINDLPQGIYQIKIVGENLYFNDRFVKL